MLAQRLQAKPEPHEDPLPCLLCGRLLQQEAAIFSQSPSTPPGCDVGYGEREFQRQLSASRLLLCFFWSCVSTFNGTLYAVRHKLSQPCSIEKYFDKMAASYMARIPQSSSCGSNSAYSRCTYKHDFISNQLLFYCWLTQQHFQLQCFLLSPLMIPLYACILCSWHIRNTNCPILPVAFWPLIYFWYFYPMYFYLCHSYLSHVNLWHFKSDVSSSDISPRTFWPHVCTLTEAFLPQCEMFTSGIFTSGIFTPGISTSGIFTRHFYLWHFYTKPKNKKQIKIMGAWANSRGSVSHFFFHIRWTYLIDQMTSKFLSA